MRERAISGPNQEQNPFKPEVRRLSREEILFRTLPGLPQDYGYTDNEYSRFVEKNIIGLDIGGVTLLLANIDHHNIDPITRNLIASPKTERLFAEYFGPDLARHGLYEEKNVFTKIGKRSNPQKLQFAQTLADICRDLEKPVNVADIANGPSYELLYTASRGVVFGGAPLGILNALLYDHPILAGLVSLLYANSVANIWQETQGTGIFNPDKVSRFERVFVDLEQSRRLFAAKGIQQMAEEMARANPSTDKGTILALYPKAHGERIADLLEHPKPVKDTIRRMLYRGVPFLEYTNREYHYQDGAWELTQKQRLRLLPS